MLLKLIAAAKDSLACLFNPSFINLQELGRERARKIFVFLDVDNDGELDEKEFLEGCLSNQSLFDLLNSGRRTSTCNLN